MDLRSTQRRTKNIDLPCQAVGRAATVAYGAKLLPPLCSILQNQGKTLVLAVLPAVAALVGINLFLNGNQSESSILKFGLIFTY